MESKNIAANNKKNSSKVWKVTKKIVSLQYNQTEQRFSKRFG